VPVITIDGQPVIMPMLMFEQADPSHLRTYWEKRDLVERAHKYQLVPFGATTRSTRRSSATPASW
jgi:D-alanine-D-alanine ligase